MSIKVKLFGTLADVAGNSQIEIIDASDTETLKSKLIREFPKLEHYKFVIAVYKQVVKSNTKLNDGDTVALLPPFAGG